MRKSYAFFSHSVIKQYTVCSQCFNIKLLWQIDLTLSGEMVEILANFQKCVRKARGEFTQNNVVHTFYNTPTIVHRNKLMDSLLRRFI